MKVCASCFGGDASCRTCGGVGTLSPLESPLLDCHVKRWDLTKFAGPDHPLHCSGLQQVVLCPWKITMLYMLGPDDASGPAADTGSATHKAVAAYHSVASKDLATSIRIMGDHMSEYPLADVDEAMAMFLLYVRDPRNNSADVVAVEKKISFQLPPAPEDPTGKPICVVGKVDQVRREVDKKLRVYDLKTSKKQGRTLMDEHQYQVAGYVIGASREFGQPVHPGALICPRHYSKTGNLPETSPPGVFFPYPWTWDDVQHILWGVRHVVAAIRSGETWQQGGEHCRWCPAGSPDVCVPRLRAVTDPTTMKIVKPPDVALPAERIDISNVFQDL